MKLISGIIFICLLFLSFSASANRTLTPTIRCLHQGYQIAWALSQAKCTSTTFEGDFRPLLNWQNGRGRMSSYNVIMIRALVEVFIYCKQLNRRDTVYFNPRLQIEGDRAGLRHNGRGLTIGGIQRAAVRCSDVDYDEDIARFAQEYVGQQLNEEPFTRIVDMLSRDTIPQVRLHTGAWIRSITHTVELEVFSRVTFEFRFSRGPSMGTDGGIVIDGCRYHDCVGPENRRLRVSKKPKKKKRR